MRRTMNCVLAALAALVVVVLLASCGTSSNPKFKDAAYVTKCQNDKKRSKVVSDAGKNIGAFCKCLQTKLVAAGFGDRPSNLRDPASLRDTKLQDAGLVAAAKCLGRFGRR